MRPFSAHTLLNEPASFRLPSSESSDGGSEWEVTDRPNGRRHGCLGRHHLPRHQTGRQKRSHPLQRIVSAQDHFHLLLLQPSQLFDHLLTNTAPLRLRSHRALINTSGSRTPRTGFPSFHPFTTMAPITNGVVNHGAEQATAGASTGDDSKSFRNRYEYTRYSDNVKNRLIEVRSHPTWRALCTQDIGSALILSRTSSLAATALPKLTKITLQHTSKSARRRRQLCNVLMACRAVSIICNNFW